MSSSLDKTRTMPTKYQDIVATSRLRYGKRMPVGQATTVKLLDANCFDGTFCVTTDFEDYTQNLSFYLNNSNNKLVPLSTFTQGTLCLVERQELPDSNYVNKKQYFRAVIVEPTAQEEQAVEHYASEKEDKHDIFSTGEMEFFISKLAPLYPVEEQALFATCWVYFVDFGNVVRVKRCHCFEIDYPGDEIVLASPIYPIRCRLNKVIEYARPFAIYESIKHFFCLPRKVAENVIFQLTVVAVDPATLLHTVELLAFSPKSVESVNRTICLSLHDHEIFDADLAEQDRQKYEAEEQSSSQTVTPQQDPPSKPSGLMQQMSAKNIKFVKYEPKPCVRRPPVLPLFNQDVVSKFCILSDSVDHASKRPLAKNKLDLSGIRSSVVSGPKGSDLPFGLVNVLVNKIVSPTQFYCIPLFEGIKLFYADIFRRLSSNTESGELADLVQADLVAYSLPRKQLTVPNFYNPLKALHFFTGSKRNIGPKSDWRRGRVTSHTLKSGLVTVQIVDFDDQSEHRLEFEPQFVHAHLKHIRLESLKRNPLNILCSIPSHEIKLNGNEKIQELTHLFERFITAAPDEVHILPFKRVDDLSFEVNLYTRSNVMTNFFEPEKILYQSFTKWLSRKRTSFVLESSGSSSFLYNQEMFVDLYSDEKGFDYCDCLSQLSLKRASATDQIVETQEALLTESTERCLEDMNIDSKGYVKMPFPNFDGFDVFITSKWSENRRDRDRKVNIGLLFAKNLGLHSLVRNCIEKMVESDRLKPYQQRLIVDRPVLVKFDLNDAKASEDERVFLYGQTQRQDLRTKQLLPTGRVGQDPLIKMDIGPPLFAFADRPDGATSSQAAIYHRARIVGVRRHPFSYVNLLHVQLVDVGYFVDVPIEHVFDHFVLPDVPKLCRVALLDQLPRSRRFFSRFEVLPDFEKMHSVFWMNFPCLPMRIRLEDDSHSVAQRRDTSASSTRDDSLADTDDDFFF